MQFYSNNTLTTGNCYYNMEAKILKSTTFFMMPFYFKNWENDIKKGIAKEKSMWVRSKMNIDDNILYSHIQEFISTSVIANKETKELVNEELLANHDYHIYSLSQEPSGLSRMMDNNIEYVILGKQSNDGNDNIPISFKFNNTEKDYPRFFSPKLIVCPNAQVGLLMFSVDMVGNTDIKSLMQLNYELYKTYDDDSSQTTSIYLPNQLKLFKLDNELKLMRKNISKYIKANRKLKLKKKDLDETKAKSGTDSMIAKNNGKIREEYSLYRRKHEEFHVACQKDLLENNSFLKRVDNIDKAMNNEKNSKHDIRSLLNHHWTIGQLMEALMSDFDGKYIRADKYRLHVFTYLQVDEKSSPDSELLENFSRIIRCQDKDYLTLSEFSGKSVYEKLFENVYVGCSVEGGGVMTFLRGPGDDFMKNFDTGPLTKSYLWIYILAIMQRHTLLQMSRNLAEEYGYSGDDLNSRMHNLRELTRKMSKTKINTYFTDVSDHSHLNALYSFCCRNLCVDKYFLDVDNKLSSLKETLEQLHDEQMEINDKLQNWLLKWVGVLALTLTCFSALNDSYDYFEKFFDDQTTQNDRAAIVIIIIIFFGICAWCLVKIIQEIYVGKTLNNKSKKSNKNKQN